ncbi:MAG: DNA mismatch repair endonuclease MutL, partial [Eubacteriales bacterium]
ELMENSIDAGATAITVEIADGGVKKVRVTDNGSGMSQDDAVLAIKRHATSKISEFSDLDAIGTLGFRGEALSAIAAVSQVEISTKSAAEDIGIKLVVNGGVLQEKTYIGMADGTTILVQNLFYNTPARLKFLKTHGSEGAAVSDIVSRFILAYPDVAIQYINNDKTVMQSFGDGKLSSAAAAIYGADIGSKTVPVKYETDGIAISGLLGLPQYAFKNRKMQSLFINGRYILSDAMTKIIAKAYDTWLVPGLFPFYVLSVTMPTSETDVNIHPNKLEIKFKNGEALSQALEEAVSFSLSSTVSLPRITMKPKTEEKQKSEQQVFEPLQTKDKRNKEDILASKVDDIFGFPAENKPFVSAPSGLDQAVPDDPKNAFTIDLDFASTPHLDKNENQTPEITKITIAPDIRYIGSFKNTYLLAECGEDLLLVDQHAAHERIIFDRLMENYKKRKPKSQMLMLSEALTVSNEEYELLKAHKTELNDLGFIFSLDEKLSVSFSAVPSDLTDLSLDAILDDIYTAFGANKGTQSQVEALIMKSCKSAIKAGNVLPFEESRYLLEQFIDTGHIPACPHGRPIIAVLTQKELEKVFKRTV